MWRFGWAEEKDIHAKGKMSEDTEVGLYFLGARMGAYLWTVACTCACRGDRAGRRRSAREER
jgi:hypothetical protein